MHIQLTGKEKILQHGKFILIALIIVLVCSLFFNVGLLCAFLFPEVTTLINTIIICISFTVSFGVVPFFIFKVYLFEDIAFEFTLKKAVKYFIEITFVFFVFDHFFDDTISLLIGLFVASFEEILFRFYILNYLKKYSSLIFSIIFNSLLFAVILHLNESFIVNILVRFPLGILLSVLKNYFGLSKSILFHWIYNSLVVFL